MNKVQSISSTPKTVPVSSTVSMLFATAVLIMLATLTPVVAAELTQTRLFWQQDDTRCVCWADAQSDDNQNWKLSAKTVVQGWPQLDLDQHSLVQMKLSGTILVIGVHDNANGQFQSGWIAVDTGIDAEDHGDHSHWHYSRQPRVIASVLDASQGNPAHLYVYDDVFYLANDKNNGFTRLDFRTWHPQESAEQTLRRSSFFEGGGGHITLAAGKNGLVYSTWADREGSNKGRVDVTHINKLNVGAMLGSVHLENGGLHGATLCNGKVFFAPANGIHWFEELKSPDMQTTSISPQVLDLGTDGEKPLRTGAFINYSDRVLFTTGAGPKAAVGYIDTREETLRVSKLELQLEDEHRLSGLEVTRPRKSGPLAFVFSGEAGRQPEKNATPSAKRTDPKETEAKVKAHSVSQPTDAGQSTRRLWILELDPDKNDRWDDAKVLDTIDVGSAVPDGHGGSHAIAFDADRKFAFWTTPGSGEIVQYSLTNRNQVNRFQVSGVPSKLISVGGWSNHD